jgi:hypothetical protein|tara:strand:- start:353 stop:565 length:213 start_codon:yes stop_codon:yes gene_type:complete
MLELTVFIRVKMDNLNELSRFIPDIVKIEDRINRESIKINREIKNLLILAFLKVESENSSLLVKIFSGLA